MMIKVVKKNLYKIIVQKMHLNPIYFHAARGFITRTMVYYTSKTKEKQFLYVLRKGKPPAILYTFFSIDYYRFRLIEISSYSSRSNPFLFTIQYYFQKYYDEKVSSVLIQSVNAQA